MPDLYPGSDKGIIYRELHPLWGGRPGAGPGKGAPAGKGRGAGPKGNPTPPGKGGGLPNPPDVFGTSVVALLHFDGGNGSTTFTNSCNRGSTWSAGGAAALTTTGPKFGTACLGGLGVNPASAISAASNDYKLAGDFTIECWAKTSTPASTMALWYSDGAANFNLISNGGVFEFRSSGASSIDSVTAIATNTYQHVAIVRIGTTLTMYVDGNSEVVHTDASSFSGTILTIGCVNGGGGFPWVGTIDEFRITQAARYTGNFTPTGPFPDP